MSDIDIGHELKPLNQDNKNAPDEGTQSRDKWGNRMEFLLALIGYTVGLGSVVRFPMICARNGGGAFLIPFFLFLIVIGCPLYYLGIYLGQFVGKSTSKSFEYCPLFKGIGFIMTMMSILVMIYVSLANAWILFYLAHSFPPTLPWTTCDNSWNTPSCRELNKEDFNISDQSDRHLSSNISDEIRRNFSSTEPAYEFWMYRVLRRSSGLEELGSINWGITLALVVSWVIATLSIIKGVKSLGKIVYVTAILPYILLTVLLIKGLTLDSASDGLKFFLYPRIDKLMEGEVWLSAVNQVFFTLGPGWGGIITMSSYNPFNKKMFSDAIIVCASLGVTALLSGCVIFPYIAYVAKYTGTDFEELAISSGPGVAFIAYPTAVSLLPLPQLWSVIFFLTVLSAAVDTSFSCLETVVSFIIDSLPRKLEHHRSKVTMATSFVLCVISFPLTMDGGIYIYNLMDWYVSAFAMLVATLLETVTLAWIYGVDRFSHDIKYMTGSSLSLPSRIMYCVVIPIVNFITLLISIVNFEDPDYGDGYKYKPYAVVIGMTIALAPIGLLLVTAFVVLAKTEGSFLQRLKQSLAPSTIWIPHDTKTAVKYQLNPYVYKGKLLERIYVNLFGEKKS